MLIKKLSPKLTEFETRVLCAPRFLRDSGGGGTHPNSVQNLKLPSAIFFDFHAKVINVLLSLEYWGHAMHMIEKLILCKEHCFVFQS
jgi:hypothetical protein